LKPAIVVIAYNRPQALERLLASLSRANYSNAGDVPLVISIDRAADGASQAVARSARAFAWPHGPKSVIEREQHLGLVAHFRACGRLAVEFGGAVLLEDDLGVAAPFYQFATAALERYESEPRVAGICLYGLSFNGFTHEPFLPLDDGSDTFLLQLPYTQGLAFTAQQWRRFEDRSNNHEVEAHPRLHPSFLRFGPDEWFPLFARFLATEDLFMCFPRVSLTVGWGDAGTHFAGSSPWFQTPVQLTDKPYRFTELGGAANYDSFYEILPGSLRSLAPGISSLDYDIDLNATKRPMNLQHDHVLTSRPVRRALRQFGLQMYPPELNLIESAPGDAISLARRDDVYWDGWAEKEARRRLHAYFWMRNRPSRRRDAGFAIARLVESARKRLRGQA
jgi:hypothetical protein